MAQPNQNQKQLAAGLNTIQQIKMKNEQQILYQTATNFRNTRDYIILSQERFKKEVTLQISEINQLVKKKEYKICRPLNQTILEMHYVLIQMCMKDKQKFDLYIQRVNHILGKYNFQYYLYKNLYRVLNKSFQSSSQQGESQINQMKKIDQQIQSSQFSKMLNKN